MQKDAATETAPSPTPTPADEAARSPADTGPIDVDFVEDAPKEPRRPRVARVADVTKLEATADDVFGGAVNETTNARAARGAPQGNDATPKRGRKKKTEAPPAEPTSEHLATALGLVATADAFFVAHVRERYSEVLTPENLESLARKVATAPEQQRALAEPLARGLAEEGIELPWWAQLGMAAAGVYLPKMAMLSQLDKQAAEAKKQRESEGA